MAQIDVIIEYNDNGFLVWADNYPGAFSRGATRALAFHKLPAEVSAYAYWATGKSIPALNRDAINVLHESRTCLAVEDADSDVLFPSERLPMSMAEYTQKKSLCLKSAHDFQLLFDSIPQKDRALLKSRKTFYGKIPQTAREMVAHTNDTIAYYATSMGIPYENAASLVENRKALFAAIEAQPDFLYPRVVEGDAHELWTLKKLLRRVLWHDRIRARALYRHAITFWQKERIENPYCFRIEK